VALALGVLTTTIVAVLLLQRVLNRRAERRGDAAAAGRNCWKVERAERFRCVADAEEYYRVLRDAILAAERSVFILGWDIAAGVDLRPGFEDPEAPTRLGALLDLARGGAAGCTSTCSSGTTPRSTRSSATPSAASSSAGARTAASASASTTSTRRGARTTRRSSSSTTGWPSSAAST
jgi:hypothetical protein